MIQVRLINTAEEINIFLHGGIVGGTRLSMPIYMLHNKTLVFTAPVAVTVTFNSGGDQVPLSLSQVINQINLTAGLAGVARAFDSKLHLEEPAPTLGVSIANTSTAAPLLGFGDSGRTGDVINPFDGTAPRLLSIVTPPTARSAYALVLEY